MFVLYAVILLLASFVMWLKNKYYLPKSHRLAIVIVFAVVVIAGTFWLVRKWFSRILCRYTSWFALSFSPVECNHYSLPTLERSSSIHGNCVSGIYWDGNQQVESCLCGSYWHIYRFYYHAMGSLPRFLCVPYIWVWALLHSICCIFSLTLSLSVLSTPFCPGYTFDRTPGCFRKIMNTNNEPSTKSLDDILSQAERKTLRLADSGLG